MNLDDDLEELIKLAFEANHSEAEYYLRRILRNTPNQIKIVIAGNSEYQEDESYFRENKEFYKIERLISFLRR